MLKSNSNLHLFLKPKSRPSSVTIARNNALKMMMILIKMKRVIFWWRRLKQQSSLRHRVRKRPLFHEHLLVTPLSIIAFMFQFRIIIISIINITEKDHKISVLWEWLFVLNRRIKRIPPTKKIKSAKIILFQILMSNLAIADLNPTCLSFWASSKPMEQPLLNK